MNKFHGTGVALITPFKADGTVDHSGLKKVIDPVMRKNLFGKPQPNTLKAE
jgi:dihydrodipicolinate synthase/N-acetylneuraminate lyase